MDIDQAGVYRPKTKQTRDAYEALLSVIHQQFGEQPQVCTVAGGTACSVRKPMGTIDVRSSWDVSRAGYKEDAGMGGEKSCVCVCVCVWYAGCAKRCS
jgi:hypothetical protein